MAGWSNSEELPEIAEVKRFLDLTYGLGRVHSK